MNGRKGFSSRFFTVLLVVHVLCYALALPLVGWKWLIFPALAAIVIPVLPRRLPGKHPFWKLWLAGFCFWFYVAHFVRFPHWINYGLWVAMAAYLGVYLPLFTYCARNLFHHRLPRLFYPILGRCVFSPVFRTVTFLFSVTICWAGCDVLRGWVFSGFMMGSASDVFYRDPMMLQTADLFGQWGVSAFLVYLSACGVLIFKASLIEGGGPKDRGELGSEGNPSQCRNPPVSLREPAPLKGGPLNGGLRAPAPLNGGPLNGGLREPAPLNGGPLNGGLREPAPLKGGPLNGGLRAPAPSRKGFLPPFVALLFGLIFLLGYGDWRLHQPNPNAPCGTIALLQGNVPAELETTPELVEKTEAVYLKLAQEVRTRGGVDLAVYPECVFRSPVLFAEPNAFQSPEFRNADGTPLDSEVYQNWLARASKQSQEDLLNFAHYGLKTQFLTGCSTFYYGPDRVEAYNSAIFVGPETQELDPAGAYHKMILVPFGEYVPLVPTLRKWFPTIENFLPIGSQDAGKEPVCVTFRTKEGRELRASLSICYESALSRLTRRQVAGLREKGMEPDCIINLTNNGWFGQSHETRMHEACGVFRAIENRKPLLTAANWGITASIDSNGRILGEVPTGASRVLYASIQPDSRRTFFTAWGGWLLWVPLVGMAFGGRRKTRSRGSRFAPLA